MRAHLVRALLAILAVGMFVLPVEAQRRSRGGDRDREVRVDVQLRNGRPSVRLTAYERSFYARNARYRVSLRRLARTSPRIFRRVLRDHRELHREMRRRPARRANQMHAQWHRQHGWSHREFVNVQWW